MNKAIIRLEKLIPGALVIELENYKTGGTKRMFSWDWDQKVIRVNIDVAVSIFSVPRTTKMYEKAYFKINDQDKEEFLAYATELGYYYDNTEDGKPKLHKYTEEEVNAILKKGALQKLEDIFKEENVAGGKLVHSCAIKLQKELSSRTIKKVESLLGMPITVEGSEYDDE